MIQISTNGYTNLKRLPILFLIFTLISLAACTPETILTPGSVGTVGESLGLTPLPVMNTPAPTHPVQPTITTVPLGIEPEDLQGVAIQFWHPWTQDVAYVVESLVEQFNDQNPYGILVTAMGQGGNLYQNVQEGIRTGLVPDVSVAMNYQIQSWDNYGNFITDLEVYVHDPEWGLTETEIADFYPPRWEQDLFKGKRLGLPAQTSAAVLFYNQSWAAELGFESPPETAAGFKDQACAAAAASILTASSVGQDSHGIGGWIASTDPGSVMGWVLAFGEDGVAEGGDGYAFDTPAANEAFAFIKSLFKSGCAWVPDDRNPNSEFATRKGLFFSSDILGLPYQRSVFEFYDGMDEWVPIPYPGVAGAPAINLYGLSFATLKTTPTHQLAAWVFIKWMTQPENQVPFIEASGYLPTRASTMDLMGDYARAHPHWVAARDLISNSRVEPGFGSWVVARWALSDAASELISSDFSSERIPPLLKDLDALLAEIHIQNR